MQYDNIWCSLEPIIALKPVLHQNKTLRYFKFMPVALVCENKKQ